MSSALARLFTVIALIGGGFLLFGGDRNVPAPVLTIYAAASLAPALEDVATNFEAAAGTSVRLVTGGTSALARQIENGAPADVFISADALWMDAMQATGLIRADTRVAVAANRLVVIVPAVRGAEGLAVLTEGRVALALVDAVPAGRYAKAALQSLGLWGSVAPRVVEVDNVRAALTLVALGEAQSGIVYATDAASEPRVTVAMVVDPAHHAPILYPAAVVTGTAMPTQAAAFLDFLRGSGAEILARHGFLSPSQASTLPGAAG